MPRPFLPALVLALAALPALAQAPQSVRDDAPELPGGDIFGFTSPTDVGSPGDRGLGIENTARLGKPGGGSYLALGTKYQLGLTVAENVGVALSGSTAAHRIRAVPDLEDQRQIGFDGASVEVLWRVLPRTASGIAATVAVEPRWSRVDSLTGLPAEGYGVEAKLFLDAILVPNRLYAGLNLNVAPAVSRAGEPGASWERSSGTSVSGALAYQISERVFVGVEARHLASFEGAALNRLTGQALFAGPNVLFKLTESSALNLAWTPQVAGRARGADRPLDLDNFERHQVRVKFATSF